jgi:hypothetical protein
LARLGPGRGGFRGHNFLAGCDGSRQFMTPKRSPRSRSGGASQPLAKGFANHFVAVHESEVGHITATPAPAWHCWFWGESGPCAPSCSHDRVVQRCRCGNSFVPIVGVVAPRRRSPICNRQPPEGPHVGVSALFSKTRIRHSKQRRSSPAGDDGG